VDPYLDDIIDNLLLKNDLYREGKQARSGAWVGRVRGSRSSHPMHCTEVYLTQMARGGRGEGGGGTLTATGGRESTEVSPFFFLYPFGLWNHDDISESVCRRGMCGTECECTCERKGEWG
jgi:hypothetical protein